MIIKTKEFQEICKGILEAVDETNNGIITDTLELKVEHGKMFLSVTNREYFITVSLDVNTEETLRAVISASLFLKLVSKITTEEIDITMSNNALVVKGNGTYKFPLIFDGDKLLELPRISLGNITNEFTVSTEVLQDILKYNTKELQKSGIRMPVHKMFYIDEKGAITYASGACVTSFSLNQPVKLLLSEKLVKLFKLFTSESVALKIGVAEVASSLQTRIKLQNDSVELTAITNSDASMLSSVPANIIRNIADTAHTNKVIFNKQAVLDALNRLSIFAKKDVVTLYTYLEFTDTDLIIYDTRKENNETIKLDQSNVTEKYVCILNTNDFKTTLETQKEEVITMRFGNHKSVTVERPKIKIVLPECRIN